MSGWDGRILAWSGGTMPRQARADAAGQCYHVMARGIERRAIFSDDEDYVDLLERLEVWLRRSGGKCLAWCLMPNHFHFMLLRGERPLSELMHHVMTGYAVHYNHRHHRCGHLFQNRYKSIICSLEEYFLQAVPYIHLNPLRAGLVRDLQDLEIYPWCGHRALVTGDGDGILCARSLLEHYGGGEAGLARYMMDMEERAAQSSREKAEGRKRIANFPKATRDLVAEILGKAAAAAVRPLRTRVELLKEAASRTGVDREEILRPSRKRSAAKARAIYCYLCREQAGVGGPELMAELNIKQSGVSKLIAKGRALLAGEIRN